MATAGQRAGQPLKNAKGIPCLERRVERLPKPRVLVSFRLDLATGRRLSNSFPVNTDPVHLHVLLNHLLLTGLAVAVVVLLAALFMRNKQAAVLGLVMVGLLAGSAWPVIESGESSYVRVRELADEDGKAQLRHHMLLAEHWGNLYYATAVAAALGLLAAWKWPRGFYGLAALAAALALASLLAGAFIAAAGGKIRHPEFRSGSPPANGSSGEGQNIR
jgi:hypothetical protein